MTDPRRDSAISTASTERDSDSELSQSRSESMQSNSPSSKNSNAKEKIPASTFSYDPLAQRSVSISLITKGLLNLVMCFAEDNKASQKDKAEIETEIMRGGSKQFDQKGGLLALAGMDWITLDERDWEMLMPFGVIAAANQKYSSQQPGFMQQSDDPKIRAKYLGNYFQEDRINKFIKEHVKSEEYKKLIEDLAYTVFELLKINNMPYEAQKYAEKKGIFVSSDQRMNQMISNMKLLTDSLVAIKSKHKTGQLKEIVDAVDSLKMVGALCQQKVTGRVENDKWDAIKSEVKTLKAQVLELQTENSRLQETSTGLELELSETRTDFNNFKADSIEKLTTLQNELEQKNRAIAAREAELQRLNQAISASASDSKTAENSSQQKHSEMSDGMSRLAEENARLKAELAAALSHKPPQLFQSEKKLEVRQPEARISVDEKYLDTLQKSLDEYKSHNSAKRDSSKRVPLLQAKLNEIRSAMRTNDQGAVDKVFKDIKSHVEGYKKGQTYGFFHFYSRKFGLDGILKRNFPTVKENPVKAQHSAPKRK